MGTFLREWRRESWPAATSRWSIYMFKVFGNDEEVEHGSRKDGLVHLVQGLFHCTRYVSYLTLGPDSFCSHVRSVVRSVCCHLSARKGKGKGNGKGREKKQEEKGKQKKRKGKEKEEGKGTVKKKGKQKEKEKGKGTGKEKEAPDRNPPKKKNWGPKVFFLSFLARFSWSACLSP